MLDVLQIRVERTTPLDRKKGEFNLLQIGEIIGTLWSL